MEQEYLHVTSQIHNSVSAPQERLYKPVIIYRSIQEGMALFSIFLQRSGVFESVINAYCVYCVYVIERNLLAVYPLYVDFRL